MIDVHFWGALRPVFGGASSVKVEAADIRALFRKLSGRKESAPPGPGQT